MTLKKVRKIFLWVVACTMLGLGSFLFAARFLTPWPSVLLIRAVFDKGAANASAKLQKHVPTGIVAQEGVRYDPADPDALLDIYRSERLNRHVPTIVWIHGGGFVSGRRGDIANYLKVLAGLGFVTVSVDYTLAPSTTYPAPVRQVSRALAFLVHEDAGLGINPDALVIAGDSAGAQIAAQTANIITSSAYAREVGIDAPIAADKLKGILLYCGVYDISRFDHVKEGIAGWFLRTVTWAYSGKRDWRKVPGFDHISVAREVTARFPPTFISAGNADLLAPQSVVMENSLRKAGVPVQSLFYSPDHQPKLNHEYQFDLDTPDGQATLTQSATWLAALPMETP